MEGAPAAAGGDQEDEYDQDDAVCQPVPFRGPTPPSPRPTALSEDSDSEDGDSYIPSEGAGLPPGESNTSRRPERRGARPAVSAQNNTPSEVQDHRGGRACRAPVRGGAGIRLPKARSRTTP